MNTEGKNLFSRILLRAWRIITFRKGVYGTYGKKNHFSEYVIIYESAKIGNYNYFAPFSMVSNCKIGNYCSIGPGAKVGMAEHDLSACSTRSIINNGDGGMKLFDYAHPTIIENDVWLGANVLVKQGVKVGTGSVVGANSVVTHDVPPYAIVVGAPARIIRYRLAEEKIECLLESEWFNLSLESAKETLRRVKW